MILLFIGLFSLTNTAVSQVLEKEFEHDLKGPVKELRLIEFKHVDEIDWILREDTTVIRVSEIRKFDTARRLIEVYLPIDTTTDWCGCNVNRKTLTYTPEGLLNSVSSFTKDTVLERHYVFERDQLGKILRQKILHKTKEDTHPSYYIYKYEGKKIVEIKEGNERAPTILSYTYNSKGKLIKEIYKTYLVKIYEYKYDDKGRLIAKYDVRYDLGKILLAEYSYNENGDVKEQSGKQERPTLRGGNFFDYKVTITYKYDKHGNWTTQIFAYSDGTSSISKREIDYY